MKTTSRAEEYYFRKVFQLFQTQYVHIFRKKILQFGAAKLTVWWNWLHFMMSLITRHDVTLWCYWSHFMNTHPKAGQETTNMEEWRCDDLICTTPRLCQNNMTPVALRGRGTTSTYNCFPATGLYFKSKVLATMLVSEEARPRPHVCSTGALCLATLTPGGGGGGSSDKHGYMAFLILAKWEWQVEDLCRPDNAPCWKP